jgi:hypothetical protein
VKKADDSITIRNIGRAAILIGPYPQKQPNKRPRQDRRADQKAELRIAQPHILLDLYADNGENRPDGETDSEGGCGQGRKATLYGQKNSLN